MQEITEPIEQPVDQIAQPHFTAGLKGKAYDIFKGLWASLFYSGRTAGKSILICSSDSGEGASTVACGLSIAGSEPAGVARVALVDLNLRTPSISRIFGVEQNPGVGEVIVEGLQPESIIKPISASLDVYPAGNIDGRTLDILRSERLSWFLNNLASAYDYLLVDAAPANQFPDAQVLAGILKDVLLVARAERTPREALAQAKKRLEAGGGKLAGLVLNLRTYPIPRFLYRRV